MLGDGRDRGDALVERDEVGEAVEDLEFEAVPVAGSFFREVESDSRRAHFEF